MRDTKTFISDIVKKPPVLFPLVGLFHVLWLAWTVWDDRMVPFPGVEWLQVLWLAGYTFFWLAASDTRKWGAHGYMALTLVDMALYMAMRSGKMSPIYLSNIFLIDGLFSVMLLFFYKRFR